LDISTLRDLGYLINGFQIFPEITGYTRDTAIIEYAAKILKPYHNIIGFCWMLTLADQAPGFFTGVSYVQVGTGSGGGPGCTTPVATVPAIINSLDDNKRVTVLSSFKRIIGIVRRTDLPQAAEITEACLLDVSKTPIAGTYQEFSAIHKPAGKATALGYYFHEV
jgi:hypothetical protein